MSGDDRSTYLDSERVESVEPDAAEGWSPPIASGPDRYTLGEVIGRGGMADVRAAMDHTLNREVAVKLLRGGGAGLRARFLAEAQVTARLEHPNIVPVHDLGETEDGTPYLAMKRVRGRSLAKLQSAGALAPEQVLDIFRKVCDAVAFAHARGVLHRDLKPDNIMVGEFGEVLLMDWGIAWSMDPGPEALGVTRRGELAGTPAFMSPEQAAGAPDGLDVRSDVYGLGAVLYALLTGQPPYQGFADEVLARVQQGAPTPPRQLNPALSAELERVVLRAMAARPEDRYPSVIALLEDIDAIVARRPLVHERSTLAERLGKWMDRHRGAVRAAGAVAAVALAALLVGVWRYTRDVGAARDAALDSAARARAAEAEAVSGLVAARVSLADTVGAQGLALEAHRHLERAEALLEGRDLDRRALDLALSLHAAESPPPISTCALHGGEAVLALDLQPDGRAVVSWGADGRLVQWDPVDCAERWSVGLGDEVGPGAVDAEAGRAALIAGGALVLVQVGGGEILRVPVAVGVRAVGLDGDAVWLRDDGARVWTLDPAARALRPLEAKPVEGTLWRPAASGSLWLADSTRTGAEVGGAWDSRTGDAIFRGTGVNAVAATTDGQTLLFGNAMDVSATTRTGAQLWSDTSSSVQSVGVSQGGAVGWAVSFDGSVRLFDLRSGRLLGAFVGPGQVPTAVAATANAGLLAIGSAAGQVETYLRPTARASQTWRDDSMLQGLALSPDGLLLATGDYQGVISLFDVPTGRLIRQWPGHTNGARQVAFSPDGRKLAAALRYEGLSVIDLATGDEVRIPMAQRTVSVAWAGGGLCTVDVTGQLLRVDLDRREAVALGQGLRAASWGLAALGADRVVTAGHGGEETGLVVLDARDGRVLQRLPLDDTGYHVAVSPDQRRVAVGTQRGELRVFDLTSGAERARGQADAGPTMGVAFSPDGRLIATTGYSRLVRIWDAETGELVRTTAQHQGPGLNVVFTPDGGAIYSGASDGYAVLPLDAHVRHARAVAALRGGPQARAAALASLGWWARVEEALGAEVGDGRLLAQARLAMGQPPPPVAPGDLYQALLAGAPRP